MAAFAADRRRREMAIQHTVVFRLVHAPGSPGEAEFLDTAARTLTAIPGVVTSPSVVRSAPRATWPGNSQWSSPIKVPMTPTTRTPAHVDFVATRWVPEVDAFQEYDFIA